MKMGKKDKSYSKLLKALRQKVDYNLDKINNTEYKNEIDDKKIELLYNDLILINYESDKDFDNN